MDRKIVMLTGLTEAEEEHTAGLEVGERGVQDRPGLALLSVHHDGSGWVVL